MKKRWQQAWMIVISDLARSKIGLLVSIVFYTIIGIAVFSYWQSTFKPNDEGMISYFLLDYLNLIVVTNLGFIFSMRHLKYIETDSYRNFIRKLRTMPINMKTIVLSRFTQAGVFSLINGVIYFGTIYVMMMIFDHPFDLLTYAAYIMVMLCISLFMQIIYICIEWTLSGRGYFFAVLGIVLVYLVGSLLMSFNEVSLTLSAMSMANQYTLPTLGATVAILSLLACLGFNLTFRLLKKLDLN